VLVPPTAAGVPVGAVEFPRSPTAVDATFTERSKAEGGPFSFNALAEKAQAAGEWWS